MIFEEGNKVKIINEICGHEFEIGEIVTIVEVDNGSGNYKAVNDTGTSWYLIEQEITNLEEI